MANKEDINKFPGYPHYPANEDITRADNNTGKKRLDADNTSQPPFNDTVDERDEETSIIPGTDTDVTAEDIRTLEAAEQNMDSMDSSNLMHASLDNVDEDGDLLNEESSLAIDMTGESLDVPGSNADDLNEQVGEEDEENNYYSLGGDNHESQEEYKGE